MFVCSHCQKEEFSKEDLVSHMCGTHNIRREDVARFIKFNNFIPLPEYQTECLKPHNEPDNTSILEGLEERSKLFCNMYLGRDVNEPHEIMNRVNPKCTFFQRALLLAEYYLGRVSSYGTLVCPLFEARACANSGYLFKDPTRPTIKMWVFRAGRIVIKDPNLNVPTNNFRTKFR